jgi:hypothetical protein
VGAKAFEELRPLSELVEVLVGNTATIQAEVEGDFPLVMPHGVVVLVKVLYVPGLAANLVSYTRLMKAGCQIVNNSSGVLIKNKKGEFVFTASEIRGMLKLDAQPEYQEPAWTSKITEPDIGASHTDLEAAVTLQALHNSADDEPQLCRSEWQSADESAAMAMQAGVSNINSKADISTWHARLGHVNHEYITKTSHAVEGMTISTGADEPRAENCVDCAQFKMRQHQKDIATFFYSSTTQQDSPGYTQCAADQLKS